MALPENTVVPSVAGVARVNEELTTTDGSWTSEDPLTYTYQWQVYADGIWNDISGATTSTYLLTLAEAGKLVRAQVTATNTAGSITASSSSVGIVVMAIPNEGLVWHSAQTNLSASSEGLIFWPSNED